MAAGLVQAAAQAATHRTRSIHRFVLKDLAVVLGSLGSRRLCSLAEIAQFDAPLDPSSRVARRLN